MEVTVLILLIIVGIWTCISYFIEKMKNKTGTQVKKLFNEEDRQHIKIGEKFVLDIDETKEANPFQRETIENYVQEILEIKHDYIKTVNPYHRFVTTHRYYQIDSFLRMYRHISHYKYFREEFKGE